MNEHFNGTTEEGTYREPSGEKTAYGNAQGPAYGKAKKAKRGGKGAVGLTVILIIVIAALIAGANSIVITHENEYTLIKEFGRVKDIRSEAGLSFKIPFIQTTDTLPKTVLLYDLAASDVITRDKQTMIVDSFVLWEITDPLLFVQTLNYQIAIAENRIQNVVYNSIKSTISRMSQSEVITARGGELVETIFDAIGGSLDAYGIRLIKIETKHLDLPDENKSAVYQRMISERNNFAAIYSAQGEATATKIRAEADKQVTILLSEAEAQAAQLEAEGEAEYMRILSEAYNDPDKADFYTFTLELDALKASMVGKNKTVILDKDSPISQLFSME